jgi:hypothetical protein
LPNPFSPNAEKKNNKAPMTDKEKRKLLMDEFGQNTADLVQISGSHLAGYAEELVATAAEIEESGATPLLCEEMEKRHNKFATSLQVRGMMANLTDEEAPERGIKLKPLIDEWDKSTSATIEEKIAPALAACTSIGPSVKPK